MSGKVQAHPKRVKQEVLEALTKGMTPKEVSELTGIKRGTISSWKHYCLGGQPNLIDTSHMHRGHLSDSQARLVNLAIRDIYTSNNSLSASDVLEILKKRAELSSFADRISEGSVYNKLKVLRKGVDITRYGWSVHLHKPDKQPDSSSNSQVKVNTHTAPIAEERPKTVELTREHSWNLIKEIVHENDSLRAENEYIALQLVEVTKKYLASKKFSEELETALHKAKDEALYVKVRRMETFGEDSLTGK